MMSLEMAWITDLNQTAGFEDLEKADVVQLLESHVEKLTLEYLVEMTQQEEKEAA